MELLATYVVCLFTGHAQEMGVARNLSENKFEPVPGLPPCIHAAVQDGDPATGASLILFQGTAGCVIPWHCRTPTEQVMIISGSAKVEIKHDSRVVTLKSGGSTRMPSRHVHQLTCTPA